MKRLRALLSMLLLIALTASLLGAGSAENTKETPWRADLTALLNPADVPVSGSVSYELSLMEGTPSEERSFAQQLVSSNGDVLNVEFEFVLSGITYSDAQWDTVTAWLKNLVVSAVQRVRPDADSIANVVAEAYENQRAAAQPGETGMPAWASDGLKLKRVTATVPYYPELSPGVNGADTQKLQQKLIELGFLDDRADGYYGANTQAAVQMLEAYVRQLEQDAIDTQPDPTPTPSPTPTPAPTPTPIPGTIPLVLAAATATPQPVVNAATPVPLTPETPVDGVADALLLAYLYSDNFKVSREAVSAGSKGDAVKRVQIRLHNLGYTTDAPDGEYGSGTTRAVLLFQHYNGLSKTGQADLATQNLLFSAAAKKPDNTMLSVGSSGEAVSRLQKRLRVLGFGAISVDGGYGASTKSAVETLQKYMLEMAQERGVAEQLGIQVNGVADPLLLDDFYSDSFPAIPAGMRSGASGRDVVRVQRRLSMLEYYYGSIDGQYGEGTAKAISDFQKRHGLTQNGIADATTLSTLFNENAKKALKPYMIKVSVSEQRVYVYGLDAHNEYTDLVKKMKCSTGRKSTPTPTGTFQESTGPGARWHYFKKFDCWAQYAYYIQGDIMFHSVLYAQKEGKVTQSSVNNLGSRASHGCVRLSVEDAKWIWTNCPANTKVVIE